MIAISIFMKVTWMRNVLNKNKLQINGPDGLLENSSYWNSPSPSRY